MRSGFLPVVLTLYIVIISLLIVIDLAILLSSCRIVLPFSIFFSFSEFSLLLVEIWLLIFAFEELDELCISPSLDLTITIILVALLFTAIILYAIIIFTKA